MYNYMNMYIHLALTGSAVYIILLNSLCLS